MEQKQGTPLPSLKELVKGNKVHLDSYRQGYFYFHLLYPYDHKVLENGDKSYRLTTYMFTVPLTDIGTSTIQTNDNALYYMRWIRKAIENETLIKI